MRLFLFREIFQLLLIALLIVPSRLQRNCAKWGNTFDVSLESKNVKRDCTFPDGRPICCAAVANDSTRYIGDKGVGYSYFPTRAQQQRQQYHRTTNAADRREQNRVSCTIHKEYISSPLEKMELEMAKTIEQIPRADPNEYMTEARLKALLDYVTSDIVIQNSTKWLERVKIHMSSAVPPEHITEDDYSFLSRFEFTRTCGNEIDRWTEWIEPITVTARHPFGFGNCWRIVGTHYTHGDGKPRAGRSDVDYVLLQSGAALYDQTHTSSGKRIFSTTYTVGSSSDHTSTSISSSTSSSGSSSSSSSKFSGLDAVGDAVAKSSPGQNSVQNGNRGKRSALTKHYMFDAGTSTFDSSLFWFTCGYSQRRVAFDQVFGWEMTLLEPTDYWRRVPAKWKPFWHFYNSPIAADTTHSDSPIRFVQQIATANDFVAFKLDIDHPAMEMPIALDMLKDPAIHSMVDEFFFELHFRCEVMTSCGWGKAVPTESHGLTLDRSHVLQFFIDLRKQGVRAHIWP